MLAEVDDPADRARFLAVTQREVARMEHLLSAMREITEIDARLDALSPDTAPPVDLRELLPQIVDGFRLRAPEGVGIVLREPGTPVHVAAAPERLDQIFANLLDNALSFAPPGTAVEVDLSTMAPGALVTIADRGPGIPPDHLHRLFDRFFTWRPAAERGSLNGHTGLGLAIVKAIAEGYGGGVTARNRADGGAVFEVKLLEIDPS